MNLEKLRSDIKDNPITRRAASRFASFSEKQKKQIEMLNDMTWRDYQLNVIKRKRTIPRKGDVFLVSPKKEMFFWGVVVQEQVCDIEGEDFWLVFILKDRVSEVPTKIPKLDIENLLTQPVMAGKFFWTSGVFFNVGKIEIPSGLDYGFYRAGRGYVDEYGRPINREPKIFGGYGPYTKDGLAYDVNYELIANNIDLN